MTQIYFTGSSGQGKTTLANLLSKRLDLPVIDGVSRNSPHPQGTDENQQYLSHEIAHLCGALSGIHCRTPLDVAAYTHALKLYSPMDTQHVKSFLASWPVVIYFPMVLSIENDGFRPTDVEMNKCVDKWIRSYLNDSGVAFLTLKKESPLDRVESVVKFLYEEGVL